MRAGSTLPLGSEIQHSDEEQDITLHIYPGADAEFSLYTDEGDGDLSGQTCPVHWDDQTKTVKFPDGVSFDIELAGNRQPLVPQGTKKDSRTPDSSLAAV